ncbi:MAG: hypothetical protein KKE23_04135 [Nanoarchaeota archaeon]|nr:hypothetical protein [Nanoarchaeota archaeon]
MKNGLIITLLISIILISGISGCILKESYEKRILARNYTEIADDHYTLSPLNLSLDESRRMWRKECDNQSGKDILFYSHNPNPFVSGGNWVQKYVVDCGTYYWVEEFHDWGPIYYGPFNKN